MKLERLMIRNYRTLEHIDLTFTSHYSAICGPNDSGKTNIVRALRTIVDDDNTMKVLSSDEADEVSVKDDYPKFKSDGDTADKSIEISVSLKVTKSRDAGLYQAVCKQLSIEDQSDQLSFTMRTIYSSGKAEPTVSVIHNTNEHVGIDAEEVLHRLRRSKAILFHNSTQIDSQLPFTPHLGHLRAMSPEHEQVVSGMKKTVNRGLARLSKSHKRDLEELLGKLRTKYRVSLSIPSFDFSSIPFRMTLGQRHFGVALDDWGSGTKNRTLILLKLFRAKQISEGEATANKVAPIIVVEEPESFLHPSAQAEFGKVLQDIAAEFGIQVIVTTHSPYLLNLTVPSSNVLLCRKTHYDQMLATERTDTDGEHWMKPFSLALGLDADEFKPWKDLITSSSDALLLVEGETDKEYFEMLRADGHGSNRLNFPGEIVSYDGTGSLKNTVLLRFIKNRHSQLFVTFDLDSESTLEKTLKSLNLEKKKHFLAIGVDAPGKRAIEGLLPSSVVSAVLSANSDLVQQATSGTREEQDSAKARLKKLYLQEFKKHAKPGQEYFGNFYPVVKTINKAFGT